MIWPALILGTIAGLLAAVLGYAVAGLSFWMSVLLYPGVGLVVTVLVIGVLSLLRLAFGVRIASGGGAYSFWFNQDTAAEPKGIKS